ncbi:MAG: hypothetical protein H7305_03685 [Gemmatimonadaceae bacterium]|nr:hypothetical protein [Gemmatimonadaceae bacterium]
MRIERWRRTMARDRDVMVPAQAMGSELCRQNVAQYVLFSQHAMSCIPAFFNQGAATYV